MKTFIRVSVFSMLLVLFSSCNEQKKTALPNDSISNSATSSTKKTLTELADFDPYYIETNDTTSKYGPSSITRNIIEDRNGNIWLANWEGIVMYNGSSFTNFTNKEGLRRFRAFSVLEDSKGNIWFGTIGTGVYVYNGKSFTNITTNDGLANNSVTCIYEDKAGNIWFCTQGGASCYNGNSFRNFTTKEGLTDNDINSIIEDSKGIFWFGTRGDACYYNGITFINFGTEDGLTFKNVRSIIEDKKGNIWLGGNDGLWRYNGSSFSNFAKNFVGYIYEDTKENIWTSSIGDSYRDWLLLRYNESTLLNKNTKPTTIKKQIGQLFGVLEDSKGNIWFGTERGACIYNGTLFNCFSE